jgi:serine/threonine-protein kinase
MDIEPREPKEFLFGPYRLDPVRRTLVRGNDAIRLTARVFDILLYLVRHSDRLVTRNELQEAVWQGRAVDENNLGQAISALRKALPADEAGTYVVTIAGRGYRFGVPVQAEPLATAPIFAAQPAPRRAPRRALLVAATLGLALALWLAARRSAPTAFDPPAHSVAVLAFSNMTGDPGQDYVSDGMAEELTEQLSSQASLLVAARGSAFSFKGKAATTDVVARALNVGAVLDGSIRRTGHRLRISAQLVNGRTGFGMWSHSYDADQDDVLKVQTEVAAAVAGALQASLGATGAPSRQLGGTENPRAFDAYLRGLALLRSEQDGTYKPAIAAFDQAIALDPAYALAHMQRATALRLLADLADDLNAGQVQQTLAEALAEARLAVQLAPDLPDAHAQLAAALQEVGFDFAGAHAEIDRARALAPSDFEVNLVDAFLQARLGHAAEAVAAARLGASLDPFSPETQFNLVTILEFAGRLPEAEAALQRAGPLLPPARRREAQGMLGLLQGRFAQARDACAAAENWQQVEVLAIADHALGRGPEADRDLSRLHTQLGDTGALQYAEVAAQWGEMAAAGHWLTVSLGLRDPGLADLTADPLLAPARATPDFRRIAAEIGLPV